MSETPIEKSIQRSPIVLPDGTRVILVDTKTPEHSSKMWKGALAIIMIALTAYVTSRVNSYLARDRISIEAINIDPDFEQFELDSTQKSVVIELAGNRDAEFSTWLSMQPDWAYKLFCDHDDTFNKEDFRRFKSTLERFSRYLDTRISDLEQFKKAIGDLPPKPSTRATDEQRSNYWNEYDRKAMPFIRRFHTPPEEIETRLGSLKDEQTKIRPVVEHCTNFDSNHRTGYITIKLSLLNFGDTDGVISPAGVLRIDDGDEVPLNEWTRSIQQVQKRSVATVYYQVDWQQTKPAKLEYLKNLVTNKADKSVQVLIRDTSGKEILSQRAKLPISDDTSSN